MLSAFNELIEPEQVFQIEGYVLTASEIRTAPFSTETDIVGLTVCIYPEGDSSKDIDITLKCYLNKGLYQFHKIELEPLEAGDLDDAVVSLQIAMKWFREQPWYVVDGG